MDIAYCQYVSQTLCPTRGSSHLQLINSVLVSAVPVIIQYCYIIDHIAYSTVSQHIYSGDSEHSRVSAATEIIIAFAYQRERDLQKSIVYSEPSKVRDSQQKDTSSSRKLYEKRYRMARKRDKDIYLLLIILFKVPSPVCPKRV